MNDEIPRLVLLDIMLPEEDGLSVLKKLQSSIKYKDIPVIMLTSQNDKRTVLESLMLGAENYILKPFTIQDLYDRIDSVLDNEK